MWSRLLVSLLLAVPSLAASASDWQSRSIYQLVTDRFATSDGSSPACDTANRKYCGGTWKGIVNKLDYIQNMGFDAVWISPIVANVDGETQYGEAFHGYWSQDIFSLNSHFGSADDLKALVKALHDRKMYLMVDIVVNHMASATNPPNYSSYPAPFNAQSSFHNETFIQASDYDNNQTAVEQGWLGDDKLPLPDVNTEDQTIVDTYNTWVAGLVANYSIDGLRIDTVKHVRKDFWPGFAKSAGVYTIGEVLHNETSYVSPYTQVLDAVLDYPDWFTLTSSFISPQGNMSALVASVQASQLSYKSGTFSVGSFLENHDQPRFQSLTQDQALVKNAMVWPFIQDGVPIMYYGQEQGYTGGNDPANREALWLSGYGEDKPLVQLAQTMNAARKAAAAANSAFYTTPLKFMSTTPSGMAVSKPPMLALLTNKGNSSSPEWTVASAGYKSGEALVDVLSCTSVTADSNGGITVQGTQGMPQVLLPASALSKDGKVCPKIATGNQASAALASVSWSSFKTFGLALALTAVVGRLLA